jgi:hypothetical protein
VVHCDQLQVHVSLDPTSRVTGASGLGPLRVVDDVVVHDDTPSRGQPGGHLVTSRALALVRLASPCCPCYNHWW